MSKLFVVVGVLLFAVGSVLAGGQIHEVYFDITADCDGWEVEITGWEPSVPPENPVVMSIWPAEQGEWPTFRDPSWQDIIVQAAWRDGGRAYHEVRIYKDDYCDPQPPPEETETPAPARPIPDQPSGNPPFLGCFIIVPGTWLGQEWWLFDSSHASVYGYGDNNEPVSAGLVKINHLGEIGVEIPANAVGAFYVNVGGWLIDGRPTFAIQNHFNGRLHCNPIVA